MKEIWKRVYSSDFYEVSNMGNVRCVGGIIVRTDGKPYTIKPHILKQDRTKSGYNLVSMSADLHCRKLVHRLVLEIFNPIDNMENLQVNHIDGNKSNNALENLEWTTRVENMQHTLKHGLFNPQDRYGEKHPLHKLTSDDVNTIRDLINSNKMTQHQIALMYNISDATVSEIKTGRKRVNG